MARKKKADKAKKPIEKTAEEAQKIEEQADSPDVPAGKKVDTKMVDGVEMLEMLEDVVEDVVEDVEAVLEDVVEEAKKQKKRMGNFFERNNFDWMNWLAPVIFVGLAFAAVYFLFGRSGRQGDELLVGFPDRHGATDIVLYKDGQRAERGDVLVEDVEIDDAVLWLVEQGQGVGALQVAGFIDGETALPLYYRDGVDMIFAWGLSGGENAVEVMDNDDAYTVDLLVDEKQVLVSEYRENDMRCYVAAFGEPAERVGKADVCFFSADGKVLFSIDTEDGFVLTALTLANEKEVELVVSDEEVTEYLASADGSHVVYIEQLAINEVVLHLIETKKGDEKYTSEIFTDIYAVSFAGGEDEGYFIAKNDEGLLELHVFESGKRENEVADGAYLGAMQGSDGRYLIYYVGDDVDEMKVYSYTYRNEKSEEIHVGSDEIYVASILFEDRIMFVDVSDDEAHFYTSKLDGSDKVKTLELAFDPYEITNFYYVPGADEMFWLLYDQDEDTTALYVMPLAKEEAGYVLLEGWVSLNVLTFDEKGQSLVFTAAEDEEDEPDLFSISVMRDATEVLLDDDVIAVQNAVFSSNEKAVYYTKLTGSDLNDYSVFEVQVDGQASPEEMYEDAVLLDVSWSELTLFETAWEFKDAFVGAPR